MLKSFVICLALCLPLLAWATDVNKANEAELDSVKGLGPASTARILKARENGPFKDWADFMERVKGIKPSTAQRLSDNGLTVNGQPYAESKK
ncbi:MAG: helix-hairpin-helix domain-containing protein [Rhodoferax sp.]|nr:helix-hairpin-helix domain-containing protein [Rhodoferax sp.]